MDYIDYIDALPWLALALFFSFLLFFLTLGIMKAYNVWKGTQQAMQKYYEFKIKRDYDIELIMQKNKAVVEEMKNLDKEIARKIEEINDVAQRIKAALTL
jgi:hypothetical protein